MLVLLTGLPGAGKSYLASALSAVISADILDRDAVRDAIFPAHDLDYSPEQNELASQITYQVTEYILCRDAQRILILDGRPFSKRTQIEDIVKLAQRVGHELRTIYCWAPDAVVRQRLEQDLRLTGNLAADRTMTKFLRIKRSFEPLTIDHLTVNTVEPVETLVEQVLDYLRLPGSDSA